MRKIMPFDLLAAILRLGKKYEIDYLCEEGLKRLRRNFPNALEKWVQNTSRKNQFRIESDKEKDIIRLCYELSISSCLPLAYMVFVTKHKLASSSSFLTVTSARS